MPDPEASTPQPQEAEITSAIYRELRRIAGARMNGERGGHTLQPTALVHEAYLRLVDQPHSIWTDRSRILGLAAHVMRNILVDYARSHAAGKRGAGAVQISLTEGLGVPTDSLIDVLALNEALNQLSAFDSRQARIIELHFFAGLTFEDIAKQLGISTRTAKRDWTMARAWLHQRLASQK
jgi:RNA polymerase sigma factor (TIGR02999 family)